MPSAIGSEGTPAFATRRPDDAYSVDGESWLASRHPRVHRSPGSWGRVKADDRGGECHVGADASSPKCRARRYATRRLSTVRLSHSARVRVCVRFLQEQLANGPVALKQ